MLGSLLRPRAEWLEGNTARVQAALVSGYLQCPYSIRISSSLWDTTKSVAVLSLPERQEAHLTSLLPYAVVLSWSLKAVLVPLHT